MGSRAVGGADAPGIQSLARGLRVLEVLAQEESLGFLQLKRSTGLPSATLTRVLQTLVKEGWVSRRVIDGHYRLSAKASVRNALSLARIHLAEIAATALQEMHRSVLWPSDIAICDGAKMVFLDSNRSGSPLMINRQIMDKYPRMLWSASGRCYLAFCPPAERAQILSNLEASSHPDDRAVLDTRWVQKVLEETAAQGYGERQSGYPSPDQLFQGQLGAIAVPIRVGANVIACLSLIWVVSMASQEQILQTRLEQLIHTAQAIGAAFEQHGYVQPLWLDPRFAGQ